MKPSRIIVFLVVFLVLLAFSAQAFAAITYTRLDRTYVPFKKISRNTTDPTPLLGFRIDGVNTGGDTSAFVCLEYLTLKSYITKAFSVRAVKLYVETNGTKGLQPVAGGDQLLWASNTSNFQFDINDTLKMGQIHYCLRNSPDSNMFFVAIEALHDSIVAFPAGYDGECLEVIIDTARLVLSPSYMPNAVNHDTIYNEPVWSAPDPCTTGFKPGELPMGTPCRYRLCFDTQGPQFDLNLCVSEAICAGDTTIHQTDTLTICATGISPDIDVSKHITIVDSKPTFLLDLIQLKYTNSNEYGDSLECWGEIGGKATPCDTNWNTVFIIPDKENDAVYTGIDADTGSWKICAYATDSAGNTDTICIQHAPDLTWKIDTRKPVIDAVTCTLWYDANGDGTAALGDSLLIIGWGLSNPWQPVYEVDSMVADVRRFGKGWVPLDDVLNNNRVFRKKICLDVPICVDTQSCALNQITVWAWDNACNYDTLRQCLENPVDLDQPGLGPIVYEYYKDIDTTFACIGIGDKVTIRATVSGNDIPDGGVTADMKDAGIDALNRAALPLPERLGGIYDTIWTVTEPPIYDGKDANNCLQPLHDSVYTIKITVCDDAENCSTVESDTLNRTLDTRIPRPIGYNCVDSVPCALHARSKPGGIIELFWNRACDECDAFYYYVYVSTDGITWDSIGSTYDNEYGNPNYDFWHSEVLEAGYYQFKIKTEDDCGNLGPYSCEVGALADSTPPTACIVYPNTGETFGEPFPIKARSPDVDINTVGLWYRLWPNYPAESGRSEWMLYTTGMTRFDLGNTFFEYLFHIHGFQGWVEVLPYACDVVGNCQDTIRAYNEACLDDSLGNIPVPGHFFFEWDTTNYVIQVKSVNDTISPQSSCGFNVKADEMNQVVLNVVGAGTDLFTIKVRAMVDDLNHQIHYENHVSMPCTIEVSVQDWPVGTQKIYVYATDENNGKNCIPNPLKIELCVPPQAGPCITITSPHEWTRVPCSKTDLTCVTITAGISPNCTDTIVTQVIFKWSLTGADPWYEIGEDLSESSSQKTWSVCWNNKEFIDSGQLHDGDPVYFIAIGYNQYHVVDTSFMVKVYLDCRAPVVNLLVEDLFYTCNNHDIPKISCDPLIFKAYLDTSMHDTVDLVDVDFWYKKHSDPDIRAYWSKFGDAEPAHNENIWMYVWESPCCGIAKGNCLATNTFYDFRVTARDQAGNRTFDLDEDGKVDDSTFNFAVSIGAGITVFVDDEAPQPAISMVADTVAPIYNVNPSTWLNGSGEAYVKAHDPITIWISPLPSEDSCEIYKVEYWMGYLDSTHIITSIDTLAGIDSTCVHDTCNYYWDGQYLRCRTVCDQWTVDTTCYYLYHYDGWEKDTVWQHVSIGTVPIHYPITFNPWDLPEFIPHYMMEDGYFVGALKAVLYDSLENYKSDQVKLYILDVDPSQALIVQPKNDDYVWGDVSISVEALNAYNICKVIYEYKPFGTDTWLPILNGVSESGPHFEISWHTPLVEDGIYCLRARAMDCSNNWDENPRTICVHVANCQPTVALDDPRICERTCPDDTVDTLGFVAGSKYVTLYATAASACDQVTEVEFYVKNIFEYPSEYAWVGTDFFPTNGKYSVKWMSDYYSDGRYHIMARVHTKAGRYNDSDPVEVVLDQSAPFSQIISITTDGVTNHYPDGMDITKGDVLDIEIVAIDSTSNEGWTRCYNSGLKSISLCMENCKTGSEITKCFEVTPVEDGFHTVKWNTSGLEFDGCSGCYYLYVIATDCLGNVDTSDIITVYVSDIEAPVTTIGGFDGNYVYGYSNERVKTLLFEYADSGATDWIAIGWSEFEGSETGCNGSLFLYQTSWNPTILTDGPYQIRVISHDTCSNQDDSLAPWVYFRVLGGVITTDPGPLGDLSFEKNWCVGGMHGIVRQTSTEGTPTLFAFYNASWDCIEMQHPQDPNNNNYAGSFFADPIEDGGTAKFFSSISLVPATPPATGEAPSVTYLKQGSFDVVQVKRDLGTHGTYQDGCVEVTIPDGAIGSTFQYDRYIWVAPTMLEWAPVTQPDINPIGDNNGYATYVSFTDCHYCCGEQGSVFGGDQGNVLKSPGNSDDCGFHVGKYAIIKMCYDDAVTTDKEHLAVMWWDCEAGKYKFDYIFYPATVEGFNTDNHTVEFATTYLNGPFAVVELLERPCAGSIVVSLRNQYPDIIPYCYNSVEEKYYTGSRPNFTGLVTDNVQGTSAIDQNTICFKIDNKTIYDGSKSSCYRWAKGFGNFEYAGYDEVSGEFRAGWSVNYSNYGCYDNEHRYPGDSLIAGDHTATLTAMNKNIQTCNATLNFTVDATEPEMWFADSIGAYVGKNPHFCMYFTDTEAGIDKNSIWLDIFGSNSYNYTLDPTSHNYDATMAPDQLHWVNDTMICVDLTYEFYQGGYLHIFVYGGAYWKCGQSCPNTNYYGYTGGVADCVGNRMDPFWQYFVIDAYGPTITNAYTTLCDPVLKFQITDAMSGVGNVYVYEDSSLVSGGIVQDVHNPSYWSYTPSAGPHHVDIRAYDKLGNFTVKSFDLAGDCAGPVVSFVTSFISCKTPTVKIVVTDPSGVKWDSLKVDLYTSEWILQTFEPNTWTKNGDTITVVGDGDQFSLSDGSSMYAVVYTEKTGATSYSRGPADSVGNVTASQWYKKAFYTDCVGPSITWKYGSSTALPKECERPVKVQVIDAKSGVATVMLYEDKVDKTSSLVYNASANWYEYTPTAGKHTLDVVATDLMGNVTTYTFDVKDDCLGPAVSFNTGYVTKNPTIKFTVTDPSGVDWNTVNVRVYGCDKECYYLAPELIHHANTSTGEVTLSDCILDCYDGADVDVYVYSGSNYTGSGPADALGNYAVAYYRCSYEVDAAGPYITKMSSLSERPISICIADDRSGVDWSTLEFYEDSVLICQGLACTDTNVHLDTTTGCISYEPSAGRKYVQIRVKDHAGNWQQTYPYPNYFWTEEEKLALNDPHNYPNPFDPRKEITWIDPGLNKSAYVTIKIYDFGGDYVTTLKKDAWMGVSQVISWDGSTEGGTQVANGTYLCYINAKDPDGSRTAVIKITVKKEDK